MSHPLKKRWRPSRDVRFCSQCICRHVPSCVKTIDKADRIKSRFVESRFAERHFVESNFIDGDFLTKWKTI